MNKQKSGYKSGNSPPKKNSTKKASTSGLATGGTVKVNVGKAVKSKPVVKKVVRDAATGRFVASQEEKSSRVLAATIGGAVIGNLLFPGIGGAVIGGITGALVGSSENKEKKK